MARSAASDADGADAGTVAGQTDETATGVEDPGLSYEQARDELTDIVRRLEAGGAGLEESLALWERGEVLAQTCQRKLDGARARLEAAAPVDSTDQGASARQA